MRSQFVIESVFVGVLFQSIEEMRLKNIYIRYPSFEFWANLSGFLPKDEGAESEIEVIRYKMPSARHLATVNDLNFSIEMISHHKRGWYKREITEEPILVITSSDGVTFAEFQKLQYLLQILFILAIGHPINPKKVSATTEITAYLRDGEKYYPRMDVFLSLSNRHREWNDSFYHMRFRLKDIENRTQEIFENWLNKAELLRPVYDLYFYALYARKQYLHVLFLTLAQAIETYHSRTRNTQLMNKVEFEEARDSVLSLLKRDGTNQKALKIVRFVNYPTLRGRVTELINENANLLTKNPIPKKRLLAFIDRLVKTRNFLTHYDEAAKDDAVEGEKLYQLSMRAKVLLEACLFRELGFSESEIKNMLGRQRFDPWE